ncbi:MAG: hypothetical protein BAJALOKI2v1_260007 [Promethearchaeota archaeon]|nr:MAG: hypothetical protein BAJALOKI2v1_260007 [Candidatus Lokiarchaeota archaeon]
MRIQISEEASQLIKDQLEKHSKKKDPTNVALAIFQYSGRS